jgi:hypothetical protein
MRREIERAIHDAEHPVGMGPHTGMARISAATLRRLMAENAALEAAARQALGALENEHRSPRGYGYELSVYEMRETSAAITNLRAALAQHSPATLIDPRGSLGEPIV